MTARIMGSNRPTGKVARHRRISLRLAVLVAMTLLVFEFLCPPLFDQVYRLFGLPGRGDVLYIAPPEEEAHQYAARMADVLLLGAREGPLGVLQPTEEAGRALFALLDRDHQAFVWLDAESQIRAMSPELPWIVERAWPFPLESHTDITSSRQPQAFSPVTCVPVRRSDTHVGTFVLLTVPSGADPSSAGSEPGGDSDGASADAHSSDSAPPANVLFMTDEEFMQSLQWKFRIARTVSILLAVGTAILLAFVVSRSVTRRLSRLAVVAAAPVDKNSGLPGPFDEAGRDEIALLARAMNSMRNRAVELVDDLAAREVSRREWLAQVSHDLRTPLTALLACLDRTELVLETADRESIKAKMRQFLAVARMDADRVQALVDDLFEIARLEASDPLNIEEVPPGELVQQAIMGLGPLAEMKGIKIEADVARALPILVADGHRLMRALENLLRNAIQHARERIEVRAHVVGPVQTAGSLRDIPGETRRPNKTSPPVGRDQSRWRVPARAGVYDASVRFEVRDDGAGLPEHNGEVIVAMLRSRRSRDDSAGLGLVVARKVAHAHGGSIGARNLDTGGASVWITIPIVNDHLDFDDA